jgi:hypothetical protein
MTRDPHERLEEKAEELKAQLAHLLSVLFDEDWRVVDDRRRIEYAAHRADTVAAYAGAFVEAARDVR